MMRTSVGLRYLAAVAAVFTLAPRAALAANSAVWEPANSLVNTTNYTGLASHWWFANFNAASPVTGATTDSNEARNLPSWIHLESRHAFKGFADDGITPDGTIRTGYSFTETGVGSSSTGGQASFNNLTLPNGVTGRSGQVLDNLSGTGTTTSMLAMRILPGAPSQMRIWVVLDNGVDPAFNSQARLRVSLRNTGGPPAYGAPETEIVEPEVLPGGVRLIASGSDPNNNNGVADAWSFLLGDLGVGDIVTVRPTSAAGDFGGFAGIMIQGIPEPSSVAMLAMGSAGLVGVVRRRRRG